MTTFDGRWPRSFGPLVFVLVLLFGREVIHQLVMRHLAPAMATQPAPGPVESFIVVADNWVLLWFPFAMIPVLLAPTAAIIAWAIQVKRSTGPPLASGTARHHLQVWATVLACALILSVLTALLWRTPWVLTIGLSALVSLLWANAGALFAGLWLQKHRNESGASSLKASSLAIAAFLLASCGFYSLLSVIVPLWILWVSRDDVPPQAPQAG